MHSHNHFADIIILLHNNFEVRHFETLYVNRLQSCFIVSNSANSSNHIQKNILQNRKNIVKPYTNRPDAFSDNFNNKLAYCKAQYFHSQIYLY